MPVSPEVHPPQASLRRDVVAGFTSFLAVVYIAFLNPLILSNEGKGVPLEGATLATVLLCGLMTLLMGVYARLPLVVAPGMGVNGFFAVTLLQQKQMPWPVALGLVFWSGVLFLLVAATPLRRWALAAVPRSIKTGLSVGLGLFLVGMGLKQGQWIGPGDGMLTTWLPFSKTAGCVAVGLLVTWVLLQRRVSWYFLGGMLATALVGVACGVVHAPGKVVAWPRWSETILRLDIWGALRWAWLPAVVGLFFTDWIDSFSTLMSIDQAAPSLRLQQQPRAFHRAMVVSGISTLAAGLLGTSSGTVYLESLSGIEAGGRTGRSAVIAALCFVPLLFCGPALAAFPLFVTSPALIVLGGLMVRSCRELEWDVVTEAAPAFLTLVIVPWTGSVTQGIAWGGVAFLCLQVLSGKARQIPKGQVVFGILCGVLLLLEHNAFHPVLRWLGS